MAQTPSKTNPAGRKRSHAAGSRARKRSLASGACAVALLVSQETKADFQVDTRYHADGRTTVVRRIKPLNFSISATPDGPAPANNCHGSAFEIANPRDGEPACFGYVARRRPR
jgi:hypothetical protein